MSETNKIYSIMQKIHIEKKKPDKPNESKYKKSKCKNSAISQQCLMCKKLKCKNLAIAEYCCKAHNLKRKVSTDANNNDEEIEEIEDYEENEEENEEDEYNEEYMKKYLSLIIIKNIPYYIDENLNVYKHEDVKMGIINPKIIGNVIELINDENGIKEYELQIFLENELLQK